MSNLIDANIPVLTEVILPDAEASAAQAVADSQQPATQDMNAAMEQHSHSEPQQDWQELEQNVKEAVLKQVLTRVDFVLEHRVRDGLADVLQTAVDKLADDIRAGLSKSLEELITRSVNQEISKLRSGK
jgi:catalase